LKVEIEGYDLIKRLDAGGQATVYKAIRKKDGRLVAIKVLHGGPHATDEARARLQREINALRAINHPNIVQAIAAGRTRSGLDCLVMNFIEGRPLDALWEDPAFADAVAPQPADMLRLFKAICETVQAAHRKGITHRDLSPSNILIDAQGQPHILDFGMASTAFDGIVTRDVTVTGQFIGKLKYASPEQARGARTPDATGASKGSTVDIRSDVYALGVMLYQLLTGGAFPYEVVGNVIDVLHNIVHSKPKPPSQTVADLHTPTAAAAPALDGTGVPPRTDLRAASAPLRRNPPLINESIEAIVLKALEKDAAHRYQSAGELAADVGRYLVGQPTIAVPWSTRPQPARPPFALRRPLIIAASVGLAVTLGVVAMNAKSLALYLGLATAAAPVLPPQVTPLAPQPAQAAMLAADSVDDLPEQLEKVAHELAKVEARLHAVNTLIEGSSNRKPADTGAAGQPATRWLTADAFCEAVIKVASDNGRSFTITPLDSAIRDEVKQAEATSSGTEATEESLLARRAALDAEFRVLCARFAWGAFTGRDDDGLFTFETTVAPEADPSAEPNQRVINAGVRVRRTLDAALSEAAGRLNGNQAEAEGGAADLRSVLETIASQTKSALDNLRRAIEAARNQAGRSEADGKALKALFDAQKSLAAALADGPGSRNFHDSAADEPTRASALKNTQDAMLKTTELAAGIEQQLLALKETWKVTLDGSKELSEINLPKAAKPKSPVRRPAPAAAQQGQSIEQAFTTKLGVGAEFVVRESHDGDAGLAQATVVENDGRTAKLKWDNKHALWEVTLTLEGDRLKVSSITQTTVGKITKSWGTASNIEMSTNASDLLKDASIKMTGTWEWRDVKGNGPAAQTSATFELRSQGAKVNRGNAGDQGAALSITDIFPQGSNYTGRWKSATGWQNITATVTSVSNDIATVRWENDFGTWDSQMELVGGRIKMRTCTGIGRSKQGGALSEITNVDMFAAADKAARDGAVRIAGTWDWYNHETRTGKRGVETALELDRK
jgi:serine/threonine protein kinase